MQVAILILGGGALLYLGAEWFVGGASRLALALRIPQLIIGLTVVAYGTSAPEVIVGVEAARAGHPEVALGNVIGSNIANIGLILGIAALIRPARVDASLRRRELPVLLLGTALVPALLYDGVVSPAEAVGLLLVAVGYTVLMVRSARSPEAARAAAEEVVATGRASGAAGAPFTRGKWRAAAVAVAGLLALLAGGQLFIEGAVQLARAVGISDRIVGLTIVAVGTSLPELVTGAIAAARGHSDIAVGNVVGSNIFNVFLCLGTSGLAGSVGAPLAALGVDLVVLVVMTVAAGIFIRTERTISRLEGGVVLVAYVAYIVTTVVRG